MIIIFAEKLNYGKTRIIVVILSVFPADALENRKHIHVIRRGSKHSRRGGTVAKIWIEENGTKKIDPAVKRGYMAFYLTDGREVVVPVSMFPEIKKLSLTQRADYLIMDDQYFTFDAISKIYSIKDILKC